MVLLNRADDIRLGGVQVLEVYKGSVKVWPWLPPKPPAITNTYGAVGGTSSITVSWATEPQATQGYIVYRDGVQVAFLPSGTNSWTNTGLTPNTQYTYRVAGVSESGVGPLGNQVSVRTAAIPIPVLSLTPSTTSAEVYFTTVTFTLAVTSNRGDGTYMLQRQLPTQGWVDVADMPSGPDAPFALANAIPAGQYSIGIFGASANFRVVFTGRNAQAGIVAYSPPVGVSFSYRGRRESGISVRTAPGTYPSIFSETWYPWNARVEMNIPLELQALASSVTFHTTGSQGYYAHGDMTNPYFPTWNAYELAQDGGRGGGPVTLIATGEGWMYANNTYQDFTDFGWRCGGMATVAANTWGIGYNSLLNPTVTVNYLDGYRSYTANPVPWAIMAHQQSLNIG